MPRQCLAYEVLLRKLWKQLYFCLSVLLEYKCYLKNKDVQNEGCENKTKVYVKVSLLNNILKKYTKSLIFFAHLHQFFVYLYFVRACIIKK